MKLLKNEWPQLLILALPFCAAILLWDSLPDRMPIHWNARGEIDDYAGKPFATFFVPVMNVIMAAIFFLVSAIDPKVLRSQPEVRASFHRTFRIVRLSITAFMSLVALAVIVSTVGVPLDVPRVIVIGFALLFGVLGNFISKVRPNYFVGIRTPWTLESRDVWVRTHRLAARLMVAVSIFTVAAGLLVPTPALVWIISAVLLLFLVLTFAYSFFVYKKQHPQRHDSVAP
jgi:uncharacterized membrane protein